MQISGTEQQITALYNALITAQAEFPPIPKTKNAYNYKYAPLPEIHEKIRPILTRHGLAVFHPINRVDGKSTIGTTLIHIGGARISGDGIVIPEGVKAQEQGGFITYGSRYGYCSMLGITSEDDDDAAFASGKSPRPKQPAKKTPGQAWDTSTKQQVFDPLLPSQEERAKYAKQISTYAQHVDVKDLQAYVLGQSGAPEARQVTRDQWAAIITALDYAFQHEGADGLKKLIGGTA